jgi:hypothetical protein
MNSYGVRVKRNKNTCSESYVPCVRALLQTMAPYGDLRLHWAATLAQNFRIIGETVSESLITCAM